MSNRSDLYPNVSKINESRSERIYGGLSMAFRVFFGCIIAFVVIPPVAGGVAVATLVKAPLPVGDLPEEKPVIKAEPSVVYDSTGREIALFRGFERTVDVTPEDIPQSLKDAIIAIEDQRFWTHDGVDYEGVARAARTNLEVGGIAQGGSTITQQYTKNVYLSGEQTIERKVEEALLATELEKRMSKEEILFGYLTTSYFGSGAYGIGAAAEVYFAKPVQHLDISESATLAGVVKAPTSLSPFENREAAEERRRLVLQAMFDQGLIDQEDFERESVRRLWSVVDTELPNGPVTALVPRAKKGASHFPFFVDYVEADLLERFGPDMLYQGGLTIETTIRPDLQLAAEEALAERLENTEAPIEMALTTIDPDSGHVVAMVGGRDYGVSQVNLATGGSLGFQPGSSFKPIVLAAAFNMGLGPEVEYPAPASWDVPGCLGEECKISNYSHSAYGDITLRSAMASSVNTVFAQLVVDVTIGDTVKLAKELGLDRMDPDGAYGPSVALGSAESSPIEMASAFGTFANRGVRVPPTGILRVIDPDGNVLVDNRAQRGKQVLDEAVADNITDVLTSVINDGTAKAAQIGRPAAGKTGTAQAYRAAWFVGYTPDYSTAVWMGYSDRLESLKNVNGVSRVTGGSHPAIAWREFMQVAHEGLEEKEFPEPAPIVPIAQSAAEIVTYRVRETTVAGEQKTPRVLVGNCEGSSCQHRAVESPWVPEAQKPVVRRPVRQTARRVNPTTSNAPGTTADSASASSGSTKTDSSSKATGSSSSTLKKATTGSTAGTTATSSSESTASD